MRWIQWVVLIGIFGPTFAKVICYHKQMVLCKSYYEIRMSNACLSNHNLTKCVMDESKYCNMDKDKDVLKLLSFLSNMCTNGTEMNKKYKRFSKCMDDTEQPLDCDVKFNKALLTLALKRLAPFQFLLESFKVSCSYNETIAECNVAKIRKQCGPQAESFYRQHQDAQTINIRLCKLISAGCRNSVHFSMLVIQATILCFARYLRINISACD